MRLGELAEQLGGRPVEGDADFVVSGVGSLPEGGPGDLGFVRSASFLDALESSRIGALVAPPGISAGGRPVIRSDRPNLDFARAAQLLMPMPRPAAGVHPSAVIDPEADVDPTASIGALVVVEAGARVGARTVIGSHACVGERVVVGEDCVLHANVVVQRDVRIGSRVILHPGAVIGADGFGYEIDEKGAFEKVPQVGTVEIGDDVEIGAGTTVDRARLGATRIGDGVKIDNLVQIGHNCVVGANSVIVAQSGLAGSTVLEDHVVVMAQAGLANHVTVGAGSMLAARSGVIESVPPGSHMFGFPAMPGRTWHRTMAWLARLPELARRVRALERNAQDGEASES